MFPQTRPKVPSFHAPYPSPYLPRIVPHKKPTQISYLSPQYNPHEAFHIRLVNTLLPLQQLQHQTLKSSKHIIQHSPTPLPFLKPPINPHTHPLPPLQQMPPDPTLL
ncbi:enoyl-CoA hydratase-related protein, partial [Staphylococcus epidermidis]|uniref:enoyl-CoA hydratase-related protein n=1 Tax=Staphylococcus epidermidis TaxID=1282 RepID=UPI0037DA64FD